MRFLIFDDLKKNVFLRTLLKSMRFEDEGQGFPKKLFYCFKSTTAAATADLRKTVVLTLSSKKGHKKTYLRNFFYSGSFHPGDYHAKKNLKKKIILSAPKTAATLIIAATLNIKPTVG
jgi:hypothetical protein